MVNNITVTFKDCRTFTRPGIHVELVGQFIRVHLDIGVTVLWNRGRFQRYCAMSLTVLFVHFVEKIYILQFKKDKYTVHANREL